MHVCEIYSPKLKCVRTDSLVDGRRRGGQTLVLTGYDEMMAVCFHFVPVVSS